MCASHPTTSVSLTEERLQYESGWGAITPIRVRPHQDGVPGAKVQVFQGIGEDGKWEGLHGTMGGWSWRVPVQLVAKQGTWETAALRSLPCD